MRMGIDIHEVIDAAKTKPFGFRRFIPGRAWAAIAFPSTPFISPGRQRNLTSARDSSNWPAPSTAKCPLCTRPDRRRPERTLKSLKGSKVLVLRPGLQA